MSKDTHGRTHRPAGLPKGVAGTYDRNPGTNGDDIAPPMPVHDDPDILRRELASIPQRDGPEYDGLRTRLARAELGQMESKEKHATAADMFRSLGETGGGTWSPRNDATPVVGFCHSPYPERSRVVAMPSTTDDFARLSMEYLMDNRDLLSKDGNYLGLWRNPADDRLYVDVSVCDMDAHDVRDACAKHDQIAFWDIQLGEEVIVNPDARSGQ